MSRSNRIDKANAAAAGALDRTRQAAAQAKPLASSTRAAAGRGVRRTRAWAAPLVERSGEALQDTVAPKVAAALSTAAQRLEPAKPRRRRWRKLVGISVLTAAAGAAAAAVRNRAKPDLAPLPETESDNAAPVAEMRDGNAGTSTANAGTSTTAEADGEVRTP
jgi:hypothetical protein